MRDPYKVLGVSREAGADEIKAAWRSAAKSAHPDQNRDDPNAAQRFAELGRAYEVLKDPAKRNRYDNRVEKEAAMKREQTIQQQRDAARAAAEAARAAKANAERVISELAKSEAEKAKADRAAQARSAGKKPAETAGNGEKAESPADTVSRIFGDTPEASAAAQTLKKDKEGAAKAETGDAAAKAQSAARLDPLEFIASLLRRIRGIPPQIDKAPDQAAVAAVTIDDLLRAQPVTITLSDGRELRVPLEAGPTDGTVIRLEGQGFKFPNMLRGDVVVTLKVERHDRYTLAGHDIHTILPVTLENAVLGQKVAVATPDGEAEIEIPAWSSSDHSIRLEGRGIPDSSGGRGALVVDLRVVLWEKPDAKVTDLMRHMREGLYL